ncbi:MAG: hypothetical protein KAQ87_03055 [Candidatus Pacebacteria bacterium]|nr:hypothetical protein [Candidatus Paceibacterota bacterium]
MEGKLMALYLVLDDKNTLVQVPGNTEEAFERIKEIYSKEVVKLCSENCLKSKCLHHSQTPGCGNGKELLEKYQQENN